MNATTAGGFKKYETLERVWNLSRTNFTKSISCVLIVVPANTRLADSLSWELSGESTGACLVNLTSNKETSSSFFNGGLYGGFTCRLINSSQSMCLKNGWRCTWCVMKKHWRFSYEYKSDSQSNQTKRYLELYFDAKDKLTCHKFLINFN